MMMITTTDDEARRGDDTDALPSLPERRRRRVFSAAMSRRRRFEMHGLIITLNEVLRHTNVFSLCSQGGVGGSRWALPRPGTRDITRQIHRPARAFFFSVV